MLAQKSGTVCDRVASTNCRPTLGSMSLVECNPYSIYSISTTLASPANRQGPLGNAPGEATLISQNAVRDGIGAPNSDRCVAAATPTHRRHADGGDNVDTVTKWRVR